ncbi:MAG: hypothetical protein IH937_03350 [Acidobacteria bacterium]|nr:hypothetical protein [Acidobacteriota bacterium]
MSKAAALRELVNRVKSGDSLAMDFASRMKRAREGGFGGDLFHGTSSDFKAFKEGKPIFMAPDEGLANTFSQMRSGAGTPQIMKLKANVSNTFDSTNMEHLDALEAELSKAGKLFTETRFGERVNLVEGIRSGEFNMVEDEAAIAAMKNAGFDSFFIRERPFKEAFAEADRVESPVFPDTDEGKRAAMNLLRSEMDKFHTFGDGISRLKPTIKKSGDGFVIGFQGDTFKSSKLNPHSINELKRNLAVFDPKNVRSVNAAFDPAKRESSNLLAGVTGIAGSTGLLGAGSLTSPKAQANTQKAIAELRRRGLSHLIPTNDRIQAATRPGLQSISNMLFNIEDPIGRPFESASNVLTSLAFGDRPDPLDVGLGALEVLDPSNLPALGAGVINTLGRGR